jgi:type IV pilus assembly protein PilE
MRFSNIKSRSSSGFTLIELLITVAIASILASIALPLYSSHIVRANRSTAQVQLMQAAQFMQRFYMANDSYSVDRAANLIATQMPDGLQRSPSEGTALYTLTILELLNGAGFSLQMIPVAGGRMEEDECGTLTLNGTGARGVLIGGEAGNESLMEMCWR